MSALISTQALADRLSDPLLRILDASWAMPAEKRNMQKEYRSAHIPGAVFFDIDAVCDTQSPYPHMLPSAEQFGAQVGALGIGNEHEIVVYDSSGLFSAPRVWWMFRVFGHERVSVLQGGLPEWKADSRPVDSGSAQYKAVSFHAAFQPSLLKSYADMKSGTAATVIDARSPGRFSGAELEPRAGLKSGHMPGSYNVFFKDVLKPPFNRLKPAAELEKIFSRLSRALSGPVVASCGSGVTACILALALYELGKHDVAIYDGAWAEWAAQSDAEIAVG